MKIKEVKVMKYRHIFYHSFSFLILFSIFVLLIPQTEQPDGMLHYHTYYAEIEDVKFYFDRIYFYLFSILDSLYANLGFDKYCQINNYVDAQYCFGAQEYSKEIQKNINIFGINIPLMEYKYISPIFSFQLSLITLNFFIFFILIIFSKFINLEKSMMHLIIIFFFTPIVLSNYSYLSVNIFSIFFHLFVFINLIKKKYFVSLILIILSIYIDKQNIILGFVYLNFFIIINAFKFFNKRIAYLVILFSFPIILFTFINLASILISGSDLIYLKQSGFDPFKSYITMYLSLYYLGGSMSFLSFEMEYLFFLLLILIFIYKCVISSNEDSKIHIYMFIAINMTFFQVLSVLHSVDQGRYYYILMLNIIYFFTSEYKKIFNDNFFIIIFCLYTLNIYKVIKQYYSIFYV